MHATTEAPTRAAFVATETGNEAIAAQLSRLSAVLDGAAGILEQLVQGADKETARQCFATAALLNHVAAELEALAEDAVRS